MSIVYKTKPEIGLELVQEAVDRGGLAFKWVAADELYGDSPAFRDGIAELGKWDFNEIKSTSMVWINRPEVHVPAWNGHGRRPTRLRLCVPTDRPVQVKDLVKDIPAESWTRAKIKEGRKGRILCDFAFIHLTESRANLPASELWLIVQRNLDDPKVVSSISVMLLPRRLCLSLFELVACVGP